MKVDCIPDPQLCKKCEAVSAYSREKWPEIKGYGVCQRCAEEAGLVIIPLPDSDTALCLRRTDAN